MSRREEGERDPSGEYVDFQPVQRLGDVRVSMNSAPEDYLEEGLSSSSSNGSLAQRRRRALFETHPPTEPSASTNAPRRSDFLIVGGGDMDVGASSPSTSGAFMRSPILLQSPEEGGEDPRAASGDMARQSSLFGASLHGPEEAARPEERDYVVEAFDGVDFSTVELEASEADDGYCTPHSESSMNRHSQLQPFPVPGSGDRSGMRNHMSPLTRRSVEAPRGLVRRPDAMHLEKEKHVHLVYSMGNKPKSSLSSGTSKFAAAVGDNHRSFSSLKACLRFVQRKLNKGDPLHPYWIDITDLNASDADLLKEVYNVHTLTIEDMLEHESAEKCECYDYYFIALRLFRMIDDDPTALDCRETVPYYFILFDNVAITVHDRAAAGWRDVVERVLNDRRIVGHTSWILYSALDTLVDLMQEPVTGVSEEAYAIDELSFELGYHEYKDFLSRLKRARKSFAEFKRSLSPKHTLIGYILAKHQDFLHPDVQLFLRDVLDHLIRDIERLDFSHELLNQAQTNFNSNAQWELNESQKSVDDSMRKLALVNVAFLPLTVITGMWGMNVQVPGQYVENEYWFLGITLVLLLLLVGLYFVFNLPCLWGRPKK